MQAMILAALVLAGAYGQVPGIFTVRSFGAVGDGIKDDTPAFQAALDAAAKVGGTVFVDPVEGGKGYVLTHTVVLRAGTSLVGSLAGMPFIAWEGVPRSMQTGAVILARPAPEEYNGKPKRPLFYLSGGNTIRGLYILYDRQPWPSDAEFDKAGSPYHYDTLADLTKRFIPEHVAPCGPTITIAPGCASTTIEDITCGRYYDFFYAPAGGKIIVRRIYLYGYRRAFAMREARDVVRISEIHLVPNIEEPISWQHAKLQAAITTSRENILFDFGSTDGYSITDVAAFLVHTGFKLGASTANPFHDPLTGEDVGFKFGQGPWGSIENAKLDNCVVGFDCVTGTILPNQLANIMVHVSIAPGETFPAVGGPVGRQAAFLVEPDFAGATLQITNLSLSSFGPTNVVATGQMVQQANGRAFLMDCPTGLPRIDYAERDAARLEIAGLLITNIPADHFFAATPNTKSSVRVRGFVHNGVAQGDLILDGTAAMPPR